MVFMFIYLYLFSICWCGAVWCVRSAFASFFSRLHSLSASIFKLSYLCRVSELSVSACLRSSTTCLRLFPFVVQPCKSSNRTTSISAKSHCSTITTMTMFRCENYFTMQNCFYVCCVQMGFSRFTRFYSNATCMKRRTFAIHII